MSKKISLLFFVIIIVAFAFFGGYVLHYTQTADILRVAASDKISQCSNDIDDEKLNGIPSNEVKAILSPRNRWHTNGNLCGDYAAAMLLILTDNYFGGNIIDEGTSYHNEELEDQLITENERIFGTDPVTMMMNIESHFQEGSSAKTKLIIGDEIHNCVSNGQPTALLLSALSPENPYGFHWVCAYSYCEEKNMYCVCDGWGNFKAFVPAGSVLCGVMIDSGSDEKTNIAKERDGLEDTDVTRASIYAEIFSGMQLNDSLEEMLNQLKEETTNNDEQKTETELQKTESPEKSIDEKNQ